MQVSCVPILICWISFWGWNKSLHLHKLPWWVCTLKSVSTCCSESPQSTMWLMWLDDCLRLHASEGLHTFLQYHGFLISFSLNPHSSLVKQMSPRSPWQVTSLSNRVAGGQTQVCLTSGLSQLLSSFLNICFNLFCFCSYMFVKLTMSLAGQRT